MKLRNAFVAAVMAAGILAPAVLRADAPATQPAAAPATQPSAPLAIAPDVQQQLDTLREAYSHLKSLNLTGTISGKFDVDGETGNPSGSFTSSFQAPNLFRHETKDEVTFGSTGQQVYLFVPGQNIYIKSDAPKGRPVLSDLPTQVADALKEQDLSLALAVSADPERALLDGASQVKRADDVTIDGVACQALALAMPGGDVTIAVDPKTHLIRRLNADMTRTLKSRGADVVKSATVTLDYPTVTPDAQTKPEQFAWSPPPGAKEYQAPADANALAGKPAPAFKLKGLDGKDVSASDLKGQVYILDFWATWCGPCVHSLPELDKIYQANKDAGLKVFAVNLQEDKETVDKFVKQTKLGIPVLLDSDGKVAGDYGANAIPETVVVGKDGNVRKVFIGSGHEEEIKSEVAAAMK